MKQIKTSDIVTGAGFPVKKGTIDLWKEALLETANAIVKGMVYDPSVPIILFGCENSTAPPTYTLTAGAIYFNGEVYLVPAVTFTAAGTAVATVTTTNIVAADADPVKFSNQVNHNVHEDRTIVIVDAVSGSGDFDLADALRVGEWQQYSPSIVALDTSGNVVVGGVSATVNAYWRIDGQTIGITGLLNSIATLVNTSQIVIPLPITIPFGRAIIGYGMANYNDGSSRFPVVINLSLSYSGAGSELTIAKLDYSAFGANTGGDVAFTLTAMIK